MPTKMTRLIIRAWDNSLAWAHTRPRRSALLAGALVPLAFAPFFIMPIFYLAYGLVVWLAYRMAVQPDFKSGGQSLPLRLFLKNLFWLGWCFGMGQFFTGLLWMGEAFLVEAERFLWALPFAITLLPAGLALFIGSAFAAWGALMYFLARLSPNNLKSDKPRVSALVLLALLLALAAYMRSTILTGLPWNLPAMAWASWLYPAQLTAFIGMHGVSVLVLVSVALAVGTALQAEPDNRQGLRRVIGVMVVPILLAVALGALRVHGGAPIDVSQAAEKPVHVAIIQPNLVQREKWLPEKRDAHIEKTLQMTKLAYDYAPHVDLIIWPESAIPALIDEGPGFGERLRAALPPHPTRAAVPYILTGAVRRAVTANGTDYYNSAMLWAGDGHLLARSDKHHLVPFGEYLPLQDFLESLGLEQLARLRGGYSYGPPHARLTAARLPLLAPLICYEAIFPPLSAGTTRPAALINITNDGWFGQWHGPRQHLAQSRLRGIEQGLPLLRAANTGISAAFDSYGRHLDSLPLGVAGSFSLPMPPALPPTLYHKFGDVLFFLLWFGLWVWALLAAKAALGRGLKTRLSKIND